MNIAICGGGNLGHVLTGYLGAQSEHRVSLLTTRPERWSNTIEVTDPQGHVYSGHIYKVSADAKDIVSDADVVVVCLPGFAIHDELLRIKPHLSPSALVGTVVSSTGFFFEAREVLDGSQPLFGFQRVPFIARTSEYGRAAQLKGYKSSLSIAVENTVDKEAVRSTMEQLFHTPTTLVDSFYEVALSNSNPLLHTSRLYTLWNSWTPGTTYDRNPYFYSDWTLEASELFMAMDEEFQYMLNKLGLRPGAITPILEYYESHDAQSLTDKLCSIAAFKGIASPMKETADGRWVPDFASRYFTEDFPYGLRYIVETAKSLGLTPIYINKVYDWGMAKVREQKQTEYQE